LREKELLERQKNEPLDLPTDHPLRKLISKFRRRSERNLLSSPSTPFTANHEDLEIGSDLPPEATAVATRQSTAWTSSELPIDDDKAAMLLPVLSKSRRPSDISSADLSSAVKYQSTVSKWSRLVMASSATGSNQAPPSSTAVSTVPAASRTSNATITSGTSCSVIAKATKPSAVSKWKRLAGSGSGDTQRSDNITFETTQLLDKQSSVGVDNVIVTRAEINLSQAAAADTQLKPEANTSSDLRAEIRIVTEQMNRVEVRLDAIFKIFSALVSGSGCESWLDTGSPCADSCSAAEMQSRDNQIDLTFTTSREGAVQPEVAISTSSNCLQNSSTVSNPLLTSGHVDQQQSNRIRREVRDVNKPDVHSTSSDHVTLVSEAHLPSSSVDKAGSVTSLSAKLPRTFTRIALSGHASETLEIRSETTAVENMAFLPSPDLLPGVAFPIIGAHADNDTTSRTRVSADTKSAKKQPQKSESAARHSFSRKDSLAQLSAIDLVPLPTSSPTPTVVRSLIGDCSTTNRGPVAAVTPVQSVSGGLEPDSQRPSSGVGNGPVTTPNKSGLRTTLV